MGKHEKHRLPGHSRPGLTQAPSGLGPAECRARVEALISAGRTRDAVEAAKQFLKSAPGPEAEALTVTAYEARIRALMASGMYNDAQVLASFVSERFRAHRDRIAPLLRQSQMLSVKNFEALLAELPRADAPRRREIEAVLARELIDPVVLADSPALPPDDPLKQAARTVCELFAAVTTGPLAPGALGPLDAIPRHSPLAPWKLLIRALDAFYHRADAVALANLSAIPVPSGPSRLVPVVRRLIGEAAASDDRSPGVSALLNKVSAGRALLRPQLRRLIDALQGKDERAALSLIQDILFFLQASPAALRRTFIATVLHHWIRLDFDPEILTRMLLRVTSDPDAERLAALAMERARLWEEAVLVWDRYLTAMIRSGAWPATGREASRVLLHMAELIPSDLGEVVGAFDAESEEDLRSLIQANKVLPACFDRAGLLERARAADPDPRVFRALIAHYEPRQLKRAESEAEAWRRVHPRDIEPLLYLMRAAERRGALRKALGLLADAEVINSVHPEVRQSRYRLLLASAERRIKKAKPALALTDLDRLEQEPKAGEGDHMGYLLALRWAVARRAADAAAASGLEQALIARLANPALCDLILGGVARLLGIEPSRAPAGYTQAQASEGLARACDLFRGLERPFKPPLDLVARVERDLGSASIGQLHSLAAGGLWMDCPTLTYAASGLGLGQDGPLLHRFLLARGRALRGAIAQHDPERARRCLRAARELAVRARDTEAVREASAALEAVPAYLRWLGPGPVEGDAAPTQEEIQSTIAAERGERERPAPRADAAPRQPEPRRRPRLSSLFQKLLPLWNEKP